MLLVICPNKLLAKLTWVQLRLTFSSPPPPPSSSSLYLTSSYTTNKLLNLFIPLALILLLTFVIIFPVRADLQMADVIAIKEGGDLDLSCPIIVSQEDMIISWTCDDEPANIKSSRIHVTDSGKLRIKSAKVGDSCNYRCEAADGFGTISVIIKVIIVDKRLMEHLSRQNRTNHHINHHNHPPSSTQPLKQYTDSPRSPISASSDEHLNSYQGKHDDNNKSTQNGNSNQQHEQILVEVDPDFINIGKNQTFSLECRVSHPPHFMAPQIIWLKEFIGQRPDSLNEAHERNLVVIENVFYHSLNWPRSITYTKKSASINSALLIRQTNFVHSGRYICFAGYPPYIMSSSNFTTSTTESPPTSSPSSLSSSSPSSSSSSLSSSESYQKRFKYKWALAVVRVDDPEGEESHRLALESVTINGGYNRQDLKQQNLLFSAITTNSWTRNLTAGLMLFCGIIYAAKLICLKYWRANDNNNNRNKQDNNLTGITETGNGLTNSENENNLSLINSNTLAIKKLQPGPHSTSANGSGTNINNSMRSQHDNTSPTTFEFNIDNDQDTVGDDEDTNHFYSEISEFNDKQTTGSGNNPIYKVPKIKINIDQVS